MPNPHVYVPDKVRASYVLKSKPRIPRRRNGKWGIKNARLERYRIRANVQQTCLDRNGVRIRAFCVFLTLWRRGLEAQQTDNACVGERAVADRGARCGMEPEGTTTGWATVRKGLVQFLTDVRVWQVAGWQRNRLTVLTCKGCKGLASQN
jgi:hypothetical protein